MEEIKAKICCKYAGDPDDSVCKDCNGYNMYETDIDNNSILVSCEECAGYEPKEEQSINEANSENTFGEDIPWENVKISENIENLTENAIVTNETDKTINNTTNNINLITNEFEGQIKEITAGTGISVELKGVWYKFDYSETREINPTKNIVKQRDDLWTEVFNQVDNALKDTKESLGIK